MSTKIFARRLWGTARSRLIKQTITSKKKNSMEKRNLKRQISKLTSLMDFNDAFIRVKQDSTVSDLWEEYQRQMKDAHDLVRFRNKESKPQFIELFGKRVKIVEHSSEPADCMKCAFIGVCLNSSLNICQNAEMDFNRYFVEVDENGNELNK